MVNKAFVQYLFGGYAGRAPKSVRDVLQIPKHRSHLWTRGTNVSMKYLKVVRNGRYAKFKVPLKSKANETPTHRPSSPLTQNKTSIEGNPPSAVTNPSLVDGGPSYSRECTTWLRSNIPILMLNFGSICILIGFSRSDILELRTLTMTGQFTFAAYNMAQPNILWPSVLWSMIFASVNATKIFSIFHERTAVVHMTDEQERIFVDYFMNHGVTPLQFTWVEKKAQVLLVDKGETLIKKGDVIDRIFLVIHGSTHAHIRGKRLTAASSSPQTRGDQLEGGDSGAWIGELAFLDWFYGRHDDKTDRDVQRGKLGRGVALYEIVADEDSKVLSWTHEAMEELMETSTDLRAALTRATTAAVVAKVVNLTTGDIDMKKRSWISWLSDWKSKDGTQIKLEPVGS